MSGLHNKLSLSHPLIFFFSNLALNIELLKFILLIICIRFILQSLFILSTSKKCC